YLVQIEVKRSETGRMPRAAARLAYPAPGEAIYVHVFQTENGRELGFRGVPTERAQVRAYLTPRAQGGWEGTFPDWFDLTADRPARDGSTDPLPPAETTPVPAPRSGPSRAPGPAGAGGKAVLSNLGLTADTLDVRGRLALRVSSVERGG